jgi:hypothetical protein
LGKDSLVFQRTPIRSQTSGFSSVLLANQHLQITNKLAQNILPFLARKKLSANIDTRQCSGKYLPLLTIKGKLSKDLVSEVDMQIQCSDEFFQQYD